jgi:hypothetical protein
MTKRLLVYVMSVGLLVSAPVLSSAETREAESQAVNETTQTITVQGTVEAVDQKARTVTIKGDQGNSVTLDVPANASRFEQVKVGDRVTATYSDRISVRLKPAGEQAVDRIVNPTTTPTPGTLPGATRSMERVTTVTITGWYPVEKVVTFVGPNKVSYSRRLLDSTDPTILAGLKVGDRVDVTRTEAITVAVQGAAAAVPADDPNPGALTVTAGFDFPSIYFFRGIRQETDPGLTFFPAVDVGIALSSGEGFIKTSSFNVGLWNSINTGSAGSDGPSERSHYEEDFYATLNLGFGGGFGLATTFTEYTSPNLSFNSVEELSFKVTKAFWLNPYGLIGFELGNAGADGGLTELGGKKGVYLELGVAPTWPLAGGKATVAVPVKFGFSLKDYYELNGKDTKFGFFDVGGLLTFPLTQVSNKFGTWNIHGGVDFYTFDDDSFTGAINIDKDGNRESFQSVWSFGLGVTY